MTTAKEPLWTKEYITALAIMFGVSMTTSMLFSTLAVYGKGLTGSDYFAGLLASAFTLSALLTRGFMGKLFQIMTLKKILLLGVTISMIACGGNIFFNNETGLVIFRICHGIGFGIASTAAATIISSSLPRTRLLEGIGYSGIVGTITNALGPSLVLSLTHSDFQLFGYAFWATFIISLGALLGSLTLKEKPLAPRTATHEKGNKMVFFTLVTFIPAITILMVAFSQSSISAFLSVHALEQQLGNISLFFIIYAGFSFLSRLITSPTVNLLGEKNVIILSLLLMTGSLWGVALADSVFWLCLLAAPYGLSAGFLSPIFNVRILKTVPEEKQGSANALCFASIDAGLGFGAMGWSGLAQASGYTSIYLAAGGLGVVCLLFFLYHNHYNR